MKMFRRERFDTAFFCFFALFIAAEFFVVSTLRLTFVYSTLLVLLLVFLPFVLAVFVKFLTRRNPGFKNLFFMGVFVLPYVVGFILPFLHVSHEFLMVWGVLGVLGFLWMCFYKEFFYADNGNNGEQETQ
jgi:hypothetical protein